MHNISSSCPHTESLVGWELSRKGPGQSKTNDSLKRERKKIGWERGKQVRFVIFLIQCHQCSWNWLPKSLHSADSSVWGGIVQKGKVIQIVSPSDSCWSSLISCWLSSFTKRYTEEQKPYTSPPLHDCKLCRGPWHHLEWPVRAQLRLPVPKYFGKLVE